MTKERIILAAVWVICVLALAIGVKKERWREAAIIFFAGQVITWSVSLLLVEFDLVENPVREFSRATASNFSFNFVFFPTAGIVFNLYYPEKRSLLLKLGYNVLWVGGLTGLILATARFTGLIRPSPYYRYGIWLLVFLSFYAVRKYYLWYFYGKSVLRRGKHV